MIIDFHNDPDHARGFDVIDLDTGRPLNVFYADDEAGVYRVYLKDERGVLIIPPERIVASPSRRTPSGRVLYDYIPDEHGIIPAWEERRGRIKIVPLAESPRHRSDPAGSSVPSLPPLLGG